jgi:hypothetical protein
MKTAKEIKKENERREAQREKEIAKEKKHREQRDKRNARKRERYAEKKAQASSLKSVEPTHTPRTEFDTLFPPPSDSHKYRQNGKQPCYLVRRVFGAILGLFST